MFMNKTLIHIYIVTLSVALLLSSCVDSLHQLDFQHTTSTANGHPASDRVVSQESRKVLLLYSAGFNSLSAYLKQDIDDLKKGYLPDSKRNDDVMLVYSHLPEKSSAYGTETSPVLMRLYKSPEGEVVTDTLVVYEKGTISASARHFRDVLTFVKDEFPARSYGMIVSSHATGYLPAGYYSTPDKYESYEIMAARRMSAGLDPVPVPYVEPEHDPSMPAVKSIGQTVSGLGTSAVSYEMDLVDFAAAIPMKMDYILFDACLMGGIEVAYQLRNVCGLVGFSQAEVLAEGLNYSTLTEHLLKSEDPLPEKVCRDYFDQYDTQSGVMRSATISMVDCTRLEPLAQKCRQLFVKYHDNIHSMNHSKVQRFYRSNYHWFYDLESIMANAGCTKEEMDELRSVIGDCVIYKAHTDSFMNSFSINVFSGFSMYLPSNSGKRLKEFYRTLDWNEATGLVR
jgi:hypothetical protein